MSGGAALSVAQLHGWFRDATPALREQRISIEFGRGPRLAGDGATWISFSSAFGHGRLVRSADGSSQVTARRNQDGVRMLDERQPTTTTDQLDELVSAIESA